MKLRALTNTDGYKVHHRLMYANGTEKVYSNLTPRTDKIYRQKATRFYDGKLVFIGAQGAVQELHEMWEDSFFSRPKSVAVALYKARMDAYSGPDSVPTDSIERLHDLGYLPLEFKALPEGSKVPMGIPVMTVTETISEFFWLVNYLETPTSNLIWKPSTNATIAAEYAAMGKYFGDMTGVDEFTQSIQFHDFSARGMSGPEDAARSGFAHLTSFIGTDTLAAMDYAEDYYDASGLIAISVPATEHAVSSNNIISIEQNTLKFGWDELLSAEEIRLQSEIMFMEELITKKFPAGIVSYVADTYDFWSVVTKVLPVLKDKILARETNGVAPGKLVIRPDSGDPVKVVVGYKVFPHEFDSVEDFYNSCDFDPNYLWPLDHYEVVKIAGKYFTYEKVDKNRVALCNEVPECEVNGLIQCLWETFGGEVNEKGYKVLDSHIGAIYGDSITTARALQIFEGLVEKGFSTGNIVFGVGSYTYQCNTRDTFGFAVKATYSVVNGEPVNIFKDPKTDSKKKSAKGLLRVYRDYDFGEFFLEDEVEPEDEASDGNWLTTFYKDGVFTRRTTLDEIRQRVKESN
jgi:nicotinamide phosphoribosyltransferase